VFVSCASYVSSSSSFLLESITLEWLTFVCRFDVYDVFLTAMGEPSNQTTQMFINPVFSSSSLRGMDIKLVSFESCSSMATLSLILHHLVLSLLISSFLSLAGTVTENTQYSSPSTIIVPLHDNAMYTPSSTPQPVVVVPLAHNVLYAPSKEDIVPSTPGQRLYPVIHSEHGIDTQDSSMNNQMYDTLSQTFQSGSGTYAVPIDNDQHLASSYYATVTMLNQLHASGHTIVGEYAIPLASSEI